MMILRETPAMCAALDVWHAHLAQLQEDIKVDPDAADAIDHARRVIALKQAEDVSAAGV